MDDQLKNKILDILIYSGLIFLLIYYILKGFGVINTPTFIMILPYIISSITLIIFFYKAAAFMSNLSQTPELVKGNGRKIDQLDKRVTTVEHRLDGVEHRLDGVDHRLNGVEKRLNGVEKRLNGVEKEVYRIDKTTMSIDLRLRNIEAA